MIKRSVQFRSVQIRMYRLNSAVGKKCRDLLSSRRMQPAIFVTADGQPWIHLSDTICFRRQLIFFADADPDVAIHAGITPTRRDATGLFGRKPINCLRFVVRRWTDVCLVAQCLCQTVGQPVAEVAKLQVVDVLISSTGNGGVAVADE